jgi:uncharacterized protein YfdQ (DUF2303 family)
MDENTVKEVQTLLERCQEAGMVGVGGRPYLIIPSTHKVEDLERLLPIPTAKRGHPVFTRVASFVDYVNAHKSDATRIFLNGTQFKAVLDHHSATAPGWKAHSASYRMTHSPQWVIWSAGNKRPFKQSEFAEFIEENRQDVASPTGGELLDIVRELESVKDVTFKGALKQDNSLQRVEYEENTSTRTKGNIELPTEIALLFPVYEGGRAVNFGCRLKATLNGGQLYLQYEIRNLAVRLNDITAELVDEVSSEVGIDVLYGED